MAEAASARFAVQVVYALRHEQHLVQLEVDAGTTVGQAIALSGLSWAHAQNGSTGLKVGIHGRIVPYETRLAPGDRVEIYRPLVADPKQARRRRASHV